MRQSKKHKNYLKDLEKIIQHHGHDPHTAVQQLDSTINDIYSARKNESFLDLKFLKKATKFLANYVKKQISDKTPEGRATKNSIFQYQLLNTLIRLAKKI